MYKFNKIEAEEAFEYLTTGDYDKAFEETHYKLYDMLYGDMPYGIAKGRTGTPDEWYFEVYFDGWSEDQIREWIDNRTIKE